MMGIPYDMMNKGVGGGTSKTTPPPYIAAVLEKSAGGYFIFADPGEILIIKQFEVSVWKNGEK